MFSGLSWGWGIGTDTGSNVKAPHMADREPPRPLLVHITTIPMSLTFLRGQVGFMKDRGFDVLAVSSSGPDLDAFGRAEEIPVAAVDMPRRITPIRDMLALYSFLRIFRRIRPTIVHAHTPKAGLLGMIAAALVRVPVRIYHVRGLPLMSANGWRRQLLRSTEWLACRLASRVLCVSRSVREEAMREGLCPPRKMRVLGNGSGNGVDAAVRFNPERIDADARREVGKRYGIPPAANVIGFVGRVVPDKGVVELTDAWQTIRESVPDAHMLVVGPFEAHDPVPEETEETLRQDPRVHLVGMDWNTPPLYASMDVVALPTYREGFPNVPLEAAAMELPVVATRIPGCIDAVEDGVTGTLVPVGDAEALAGAIQDYLDAPELRRQHGTAGRRRVRRDFRPELIWESLHRTYLDLLAESDEPVPTPSDEIGESVS